MQWTYNDAIKDIAEGMNFHDKKSNSNTPTTTWTLLNL